MTLPTLVTVDQALVHMKLPVPALGLPADEQADLQQKIDTATQLVCEHIADRQPPDPAWLATIAAWDMTGPPDSRPPALAVLAVLELTSYLVRYRGDDGGTDQPMTPGYLPTPVLNLLVRYHWPALA